MPVSLPPLDLPAAPPVDEPTTSTPLAADRPVELPDDLTAKVELIDQAAEAATYAMIRAQHKAPQETTEQYNERVKREFTDQVMEARRQAHQPPPPPQPVAPAITEQTRREMEAGRKQSAYWAEQQKSRPVPNARDIAAAGSTTPVFQPAHYTHEKGEGYKGKDYSRTDLPGR